MGNERRVWCRRAAVAASAALAMLGAVLALAPAAQAAGWEEGPFSDAIMCDFDGDGASSEYVAVGSNLSKVRVTVDGRGVTHFNGHERLVNVEYYSDDAAESIYFTGRTHVVGTLGESFVDDGHGMVKHSIANLQGDVKATVSASVRWTGGVPELTRADIDGPCGVPYEPVD
jgi:hypothetical protein